MTFLELVARVADEDGVNMPEAKTRTWIASAWNDIQTMDDRWRWMRRDFTANLFAGQYRFSASALGLTRVAGWIMANEIGEPTFSLYDPAIGLADEGPLYYEPWPYFSPYKTRGVIQVDRPTTVSVDDAGNLAFWPQPDKVYTIKGKYRLTPQALASNADVPEMPAEFHDAIVYGALLKTINYDEPNQQFPFWNDRRSFYMDTLQRDQLPRLSLGWPLA